MLQWHHAHVVGYEARRAHSLQAMTPALELFAELRKRGFPLKIMSGGSTGTYNIDCYFPGHERTASWFVRVHGY